MKTNATNFVMTTERCYNPFILFGHYVNKINIIDDGKIIYSCHWFTTWNSNNPFKSLVFDFPIKKAVKIDLTRKDAFYMSNRENWGEIRYDLYLPLALIPHEWGKNETSEDWQYKASWQNLTLKLKGIKTDLVKADGQVTYKDIEGEHDIKVKALFAQDLTDNYKRMQETCNKIKEYSGVNIYPFELRELEKHFTITENV